MENKSLVQIHTFSTGENAIFTNAYIVEGQNGLVVIDTTLAVSTSKELRKKSADLKKPLLAVLITHGHPDHYNGTAEVIKDYNVPVCATQGVDDVIRKYDEQKEVQWRPVFKEEWPEKRIFPSKIVRDGEELVFDGLKFTVHDLGPGESYNDSYWALQADGKRYVFIGDVVINRMHAYLSDGHSAEWIKNLEYLDGNLENFEKIYPGHGEAGDKSILLWQKLYLEKYRESVKALANGSSELSDLQKGELEKEMKSFLPTDKLAFLIQLGADPVAGELAGK